MSAADLEYEIHFQLKSQKFLEFLLGYNFYED